MKFSEMKYERPVISELKTKLTEITERFKASDSPEDAIRAFFDIQQLSDHFATQRALAYIRNSLNMNDEFYKAENAFWDENLPVLREFAHAFGLELLKSPHRPALEKRLGSLLFTNLDLSLKSFSPEIIPELQEENKLTTEYSDLMTGAKINFNGETLNRSQLGKYKQDPSRDVRKAAYNADAAWLSAHAAELDSLFDRLVKLRDIMARKMGYHNYVELGYNRMQRNCYSQKDVAVFREEVLKNLVPLTVRLKAEQAERLGISQIELFDNDVMFASGNATPKGSPDQLVEHAARFYSELSPETGAFFDFMRRSELMDLIAREGKRGGGYCYDLISLKAPFIFANFNGTSGDVDVLTHEAGHAFADFVNRDREITEYRSASYETCEVHSMSMEFFAWPWLDGFFGSDSAKYRYGHLAGALEFIPYGVIVDYFQQLVYENPSMPPADRNSLWLRLESEFRPFLHYENVPFFSDGRRWQVQAHIFERPFYYIDYCLAQAVALSFWSLSRQNFKNAWSRYLSFLSKGGSLTFTDLLASAQMPSPFSKGTLDSVAAAAANWLQNKG